MAEIEEDIQDKGENILILGAGASRALGGKEYPLIDDFWDKIQIHKDKGLLNEVDIEKIGRYFKSHYNLDLKNLKSSGFNLEDLFTFLELDIEKNSSSESIGIREELLSLIVKFFHNLEGKDNVKDNGGKFLEWIDKEKITTIISFNWDLLIDNWLGRERVIPDNNYDAKNELPEKQYYYNFAHYISDYKLLFWDSFDISPIDNMPTLPLFLKMHGSIDWKYCNNQDCYLYKRVFPVREYLSDHYCRNCLEKLDVLIVPPVLNKQFKSFPFVRKLWNIAMERLQKADKIIVFGYSMPPTDFYTKWLFFRAGGQLKKVDIIDPNVVRGGGDINKDFVCRFVSIFKIRSVQKETSLYKNWLAPEPIDYKNRILCPK